MSLREWLGIAFSASEHSGRPFPLSLPDVQIAYSYNGSAALHQVTQNLGLRDGDVVLLPAYCCGAEIGPFEQIGCEMLFYDTDEHLQANLEQIEQLIKQRHDIKAVLITHYFGFAQQDTVRINQLCETGNIALIEDCAHALYSRFNDKPLGSFGSHAIFSPRKSLPLSEGGLCIVNNADSPGFTAGITAQPDFIPRLQRVLYSIQQYYRSDNNQSFNKAFTFLSIGFWGVPAVAIKLLKRIGLFKNANWLTADAEGQEATAIYNIGMSTTAQKQLLTENTQEVLTKRRDNYQCWLQEFSDTKNDTEAKVLMPDLPDECCPLYFPLIVNNPAEIVEALKLADIESFNWWQHMHDAVDWDQFPVARKMKQTIIALPVHQNLGSAQIIRIANCVKSALNIQK